MMSANHHPQGVGQFSDGNLAQLSNGIYTHVGLHRVLNLMLEPDGTKHQVQ